MANLTKAQLQKKYDELLVSNADLQAQLDSIDTGKSESLQHDIDNLTNELTAANAKIVELKEANIAGMNAFNKLEQTNAKLLQQLADAEPQEPTQRTAVLVNAH